MEQSLGRHPLVGTTVRRAEDLPKHLVADEKHTRLHGSKVSVATTGFIRCILGASVAQEADEKTLTEADGVFKAEAQAVLPMSLKPFALMLGKRDKMLGKHSS